MKPIFLVGFMGSGKTTLGRSLAHTLGCEFVDIDIFIENRYHATVNEIFKNKGEEEFRQIERNILHEIAEFENVVVACGGGTPCFFDNMDFMNQMGVTVYLNASHSRLLSRLTIPSAKAKRPLLASKTDEEIAEFIKSTQLKRGKFYEKSTINFNSDKLESIKELNDTTNLLIDILGKKTK